MPTYRLKKNISEKAGESALALAKRKKPSAKCKAQNAKRKMQSAKCKVQKCMPKKCMPKKCMPKKCKKNANDAIRLVGYLE